MDGVDDWGMSEPNAAATCGLSQVSTTTMLPIVLEINESARCVFCRIYQRLSSMADFINQFHIMFARWRQPSKGLQGSR